MKYTMTGLALTLAGAMMGDSECLIIPALLIAAAAICIYIGIERGEQDGDL